jgi:hypothetical protein
LDESQRCIRLVNSACVAMDEALLPLAVTLVEVVLEHGGATHSQMTLQPP